MLNLSRFTRFSWGKILKERFALCKEIDISHKINLLFEQKTFSNLKKYIWQLGQNKLRQLEKAIKGEDRDRGQDSRLTGRKACFQFS